MAPKKSNNRKSPRLAGRGNRSASPEKAKPRFKSCVPKPKKYGAAKASSSRLKAEAAERAAEEEERKGAIMMAADKKYAAAGKCKTEAARGKRERAKKLQEEEEGREAKKTVGKVNTRKVAAAPKGQVDQDEPAQAPKKNQTAASKVKPDAGKEPSEEEFFAERNKAYEYYVQVNDLIDDMDSRAFDAVGAHLRAASTALDAIIEKAGAEKVTPKRGAAETSVKKPTENHARKIVEDDEEEGGDKTPSPPTRKSTSRT